MSCPFSDAKPPNDAVVFVEVGGGGDGVDAAVGAEQTAAAVGGGDGGDICPCWTRLLTPASDTLHRAWDWFACEGDNRLRNLFKE